MLRRKPELLAVNLVLYAIIVDCRNVVNPFDFSQFVSGEENLFLTTPKSPPHTVGRGPVPRHAPDVTETAEGLCATDGFRFA